MDGNTSILLSFSLIIIFSVIIFFIVMRKALEFQPHIWKTPPIALKDFSYNIKFTPFPDTINIENPYPCNETDLHECDMNDATTCIGCKTFTASCTHFDKDTKHIDTDGNTTIIPKNKDENTGYCMTTTTVSERCNPYHGDLVLIKLSPESDLSAFTCICKNPGFIGNTKIDGACDTPYICDGKVKDINKPLDEIECDCEKNYTSVQVESIPMCQAKIIKDVSMDDSIDFGTRATVDISVFNENIRNHIQYDKLIDPCRTCPITGAPVDGRMVSTYVALEGFPQPELGYQCVSTNMNTSLPIRLNKTGDRLLKGLEGPDAVINIQYGGLMVLPFFSDVKYPDSYVTCDTDKLPGPMRQLKEYIGDHVQLSLNGHQVVYPGHTNLVVKDKFDTNRGTFHNVLISPHIEVLTHGAKHIGNPGGKLQQNAHSELLKKSSTFNDNNDRSITVFANREEFFSHWDGKFWEDIYDVNKIFMISDTITETPMADQYDSDPEVPRVPCPYRLNNRISFYHWPGVYTKDRYKWPYDDMSDEAVFQPSYYGMFVATNNTFNGVGTGEIKNGRNGHLQTFRKPGYMYFIGQKQNTKYVGEYDRDRDEENHRFVCGYVDNVINTTGMPKLNSDEAEYYADSRVYPERWITPSGMV
jgi:hypothetical protein